MVFPIFSGSLHLDLWHAVCLGASICYVSSGIHRQVTNSKVRRVTALSSGVQISNSATSSVNASDFCTKYSTPPLLTPIRKLSVRGLLLSACATIGYFWYTHVYCLPKIEYNAIHPYTSWIPITLFIVVRNLTPSLRLHHLRLYGWLGCITLETYIGQFHIWLKSVIPDGQPTTLLSILPGYPLLNFSVVSAGEIAL
jgi:hypothetical protein